MPGRQRARFGAFHITNVEHRVGGVYLGFMWIEVWNEFEGWNELELSVMCNEFARMYSPKLVLWVHKCIKRAHFQFISGAPFLPLRLCSTWRLCTGVQGL